MGAAGAALQKVPPPEPTYYHGSLLRAGAALQRRSVALSLLLHLSYLLYLQIPIWRRVDEPPKIVERVMPLIDPYKGEEAPKTAPAEGEAKLTVPEPQNVPVEILAEEKPVPHSIESPDESKADMTRAVLKWQDPRHQLPAVLRLYQGHIGFGLRNEENEYVRRIFAAGSRQEVRLPEGMANLETFGWFVQIVGEGYPVVDDLRRSNHLDNQIAYGLFPPVFAEELRHTIRKAAFKQFGGGKIASATVVISMDSDNGLQAGEIVMANRSQ